MTPAVLAYATSARRPCCGLVAVWVLEQVSADSGHTHASTTTHTHIS